MLAQEVDISEALNEIESGSILNAKSLLQELKKTNLDDPSVIYLDGVLTSNGDEALIKYSTVYEKFPKSKYADASLYKIFSYYYALGYYKKAEDYLSKLKTEFPNSEYIKIADRSIPDSDEVSRLPQTHLNPVDENINYKFTIQAGAFLNADNARKLSEQLSNDGYAAEIITKEIGGSVFNIVNVGKFVIQDDAKPILEILEIKYSLKGRVVESLNN